jgi:hypothetical protein
MFTAWWSHNGSQKFLEERKHELAIPTSHWPSVVDIKTNQRPRATATRTTTRGSAMSKEAMKLALEALKIGFMGSNIVKYNQAITAIKEAIAKAEQEQGELVALETVYETIIHWDEGGGKRSRRELARRIEALYTTPQQRKPLTDEQILKLDVPCFEDLMSKEIIDFARAIEAAHGIKE